jgi:hypothetical protein
METVRFLFSDANLLPTCLMILVTIYWLLMIVGIVGVDLFDVDVDADLGLDADFDVDLDVDGGATTAGGAQVSGSTTTGDQTPLRAIFEFLYISDIPVVIVASAFVFWFWLCIVFLNYFFNPELTIGWSVLMAFPSSLVAVFATRLTMMPVAMVFKKHPPEDNTRKHMVGRIGRVTSTEVTEKFGQLEVARPGETELVLNVTCKPSDRLKKGDAAKIISYNTDDGTFLVELTKWESSDNV